MGTMTPGYDILGRGPGDAGPKTTAGPALEYERREHVRPQIQPARAFRPTWPRATHSGSPPKLASTSPTRDVCSSSPRSPPRCGRATVLTTRGDHTEWMLGAALVALGCLHPAGEGVKAAPLVARSAICPAGTGIQNKIGPSSMKDTGSIGGMRLPIARHTTGPVTIMRSRCRSSSLNTLLRQQESQRCSTTVFTTGRTMWI